jgi:cytochrome c peroxidase
VKAYETKDEGRFKITKNEDKFVFKVPSLRNITKTAPYLHDGSAATLDDVINVMATYQLAKGSLTDDERKYLTAFLAQTTEAPLAANNAAAGASSHLISSHLISSHRAAKEPALRGRRCLSGSAPRKGPRAPAERSAD